MDRTVLLLDLDDVLLDLTHWDEEWIRIGPDILPSVLDVDPIAWAKGQRAVFEKVWLAATKTFRPVLGLRRRNLARWWERVHAEWIEASCRAAGGTAPPTFEERVDASKRIHAAFFARADVVFEGAAEAIVALSERFDLHMASGNPAWVIEMALERIGVRELVGYPFGSDLAGVQKAHPDFYPTILRTIGVDGSRVMLADDGDVPLRNAAKHGILPVRIGPAGDGSGLHSPSISALPDVLGI